MKTTAVSATRRIKAIPRPQPLPLVVMDMAIHPKDDYRFPPAVTGAGMSLASVLTNGKTAEVTFLKKPLYEETTRLPAGRPLIFCLTLYDAIWQLVQEECQAIRRLYPKARIIVGGPGVTQYKQDIRNLHWFFPQATAFVRGVGEPVIENLVQALAKRTIDFELISRSKGAYVVSNGLAFKSPSKNIMSQADYEALPPINYELDALVNDIKKIGHLRLNTSLGCRYRCIFCATEKHPLVTWSAERIIAELQRIRELIEAGILPTEAKNISFNDDDFFVDKQRAIDFIDTVAADPALRDYFQFNFQTRVDTFVEHGQVDMGLLKKLKTIKITELAIGSDGFHPSTLKFLEKGNYSVEDILALVAALEKMRILQRHYVILTYPDIIREELLDTIRLLFELTISNPTFKFTLIPFLTVYEPSRLFAYILKTQSLSLPSKPKYKQLPFSCPLTDQDAERKIKGAFAAALPSPRQFDQAIAAQIMGKGKQCWLKKIKESCGSLYNFTGTVQDAFRGGSNSYLRLFCLEYLAEVLGEGKKTGNKSVMGQVLNFAA